MFQKIAPLIVLAMFAIGAYFMVQGMKNATEMADPSKVKKKQSSETKK
ncbi:MULTISPECIES: hypothetical protein [Sulfurovum]|nr:MULTISPECIES: hypothetical protein [Sulfurovum]